MADTRILAGATNKSKKAGGGSALENILMKENDENDKKLIRFARKRFCETVDNWSDIRKAAIQDQQFYAGTQYDTQMARAAAVRNGTPNIEVNMLPTFVQQVENNIRQQNIGMNVHATDEQGSEENAQILQGIVRHIEHISNAKQAYLWAAGSHGMLVPGFGFMKLETDYIGPMTFDQEIYIRGVKDPMKILPDFMAVMPDFSDAEFWYEFEEMSKEDYRLKYTDSHLSEPAYSDWAGIGKTLGAQWLKHDVITVAKYWYKETEIRHFAAFEDGSTGYLDDYGVIINNEDELEVVNQDTYDSKFPQMPLDDDDKEQWLRDQFQKHLDTGAPQETFAVTSEMAPQGRDASIVKTREVVSNTVNWIITNGIEILDRDEWHDSEFPFVACVGKDEVIDGKRIIHGIVRHAIDSQKLLNYLNSQIVRRVDAANKSAWIAVDESIPEPQRKRWEESNIENHAILYYKAYADNDQDKPFPPPQRGDAIEPAVQGMMNMVGLMSSQIKQTVGIYEAGMGQSVGDRQSGSAIQTLAQNGEMTNFHFSDNFVLSMKRLGTLITRLIPKIYDTARTVRIVGLDDEPSLVKINQIFSQNGADKKYDLTANASYDVVIDTGPTFASRKAEQSQAMLKFAAVEPQIMPVIADLIARNFDWDTTGAVADRIVEWQTMTMPQLHANANSSANLTPQAKVVLQQSAQALAQAHQQIQQLTQLYQQEKYKNDTQAVQHASKEKQIQMKGIIDLTLKRQDLLAEQARATDKVVLARTKMELDHLNTRIQHAMDTWELQNNALQQTNQVTASALQNSADPKQLPQTIQSSLPATMMTPSAPYQAAAPGPQVPPIINNQQ
jgi:hypothetical protein